MKIMTSDNKRELKEGEYRTTILIDQPIKQYFEDHPETGRAKEDKTFSEHLKDILPESDADVEHGLVVSERLKVTPEVKEQVDNLTGDGLHKGDVIGLYCLKEAVQRDDVEVNEQLATAIMSSLFPEVVNNE